MTSNSQKSNISFMRKCKSIIIIFAIILILPEFAQARRPFFNTEDAIPVNKGKSRIEAGIRYDRFSTSNSVYDSTVELRYGIINDLDFEVEVPYILLNRDGIDDQGVGDLKLKTKILFNKGREANPLSIGGQIFIKFPSCDEELNLTSDCTGKTDKGFLAIATKEFYPVTVHLNIGFNHVGDTSQKKMRDIFIYSLAFEFQPIVKENRLFLEMSGETSRDPHVNSQPLIVWAGATQDIINDLTVDAGVGIGLSASSPDYSTGLGITYRIK